MSTQLTDKQLEDLIELFQRLKKAGTYWPVEDGFIVIKIQIPAPSSIKHNGERPPSFSGRD